MALSDDLVGYYAMEERFDEAIAAVNSVPPHAMPLLSVSGLLGTFVQSVPGKVGLAAKGTLGAQTVALEADADHAIARLDKDKTFAFWMRWDDPKGEQLLLGKSSSSSGSEYEFGHDGITVAWKLSSATHSLAYPVLPSPFQWYFIIIWYDHSESRAYMRVNGGAVVSAPFVVTPVSGSKFITGTGPSTIDELGIWDRILTAAEQDALYNDGDGISYDDITAVAVSSACRELECCDDNPAEYVATAGEGKGYDSLCEPLPKVMFEPPSGTKLIMPSIVAMRSDIPGAVIHYTTDGSAPDRNSATYTTPITVDSPADVIRAIAIVAGCPEGPEAVAQYQQWSPAAHFTYGCGVVDKSGQWGAFAADGNSDYNWQIQIQFNAITGIKRLDVLQLFADGTFTGAAWSTAEYIYPWEDDATKQHQAFPLVMWDPDHTGAQVNVAYVEDFSATYGNFGVGSHTRTLYGSPWTTLPTTHLFKLRITFQDGTYVEKVVDSTCDALPAALCPIPTFSAITPQCGPPLRIDLTYAVGIGVPYGIFRRVAGSGGEFTLLISGNTAASPETYQDSTVSAGVSYEYFIQTLPPSCIEYRYSEIYTAQAIPNASVSIAANPTTIDSGASTTISWSSINNSGTVSISPTIGAQPGNVPGNQVVSPAVTTTYIITGQNVCGTVSTAQVTVVVNPPASCGANQPLIVAISGYRDLMFINGLGSPSFCVFDRPDPNDPNWNGFWVQSSGCLFRLAGTQRAILARTSRLSTNSRVELVGAQWVLEVYGIFNGADILLWRGTKGTGTTPVGSYVRTSGCSLQPTGLTLIEVSSASCGGAQPGSVTISGYVDNLFVDALTGCPALAVAAHPAWDGVMTYRPWVGPCEFLTDYSIYTFVVDGGGRRVLTRSRVRISGGVWMLTVQSYQGGSDITAWEGTKASGDTPLGVYNRTTGCATTPSTITLV